MYITHKVQYLTSNWPPDMAAPIETWMDLSIPRGCHKEISSVRWQPIVISCTLLFNQSANIGMQIYLTYLTMGAGITVYAVAVGCDVVRGGTGSSVQTGISLFLTRMDWKRVN